MADQKDLSRIAKGYHIALTDKENGGNGACENCGYIPGGQPIGQDPVILRPADPPNKLRPVEEDM